MKRLLSWMLMAAITTAVILFTIENLQTVEIGLWPLYRTKPVPLYLVVLVSLLLGFIAGGVMAWISGGRRRRRARELANRNAALLRQIEELRRDQAAAQARLPAAGPTPRATSLTGT